MSVHFPSRNFVSKGWGWEDWIINSPLYCGKVLFFKKGKKCSWHYHKRKTETFYLQSGKLKVYYSFEDCMVDDQFDFTLANELMMGPGDHFHLPADLKHQMYAEEDSYLFEFSTQHFDEDSFRLEKGD